VEYQSPSIKKTDKTHQVLLPNHKSELHVRRRHPNPTRWLHCALCTASLIYLSLVGCITPSNAVGNQRDRELSEAGVALCLRPFTSLSCLPP
uniref:Transmembrane protein n=1 Tax=Mesocestoides corti TaxID=53468 RepID=A0A5K3FU55_MESCO